MHIPDGYLSPQTCAIMYGASAPFWYHASKRVNKILSSQAAPLLAVFAATTFTIQMFNFPVPPGTTAHAVGGTLVAIVLGPSAAIVGVSVALTIQALFFGDGGITAIGANAFNMAIALPLSGYAVYSLLSRGAALHSRRRIIAAGIGGYVGINVAGILVALELGIQPILWSVGDRPLYNPYGLSATIPAMALTHLTLAGFAEAALTAMGLAYLLRVHSALFAPAVSLPTNPGHRLPKSLLAGLAVLVLLVPLGLLASGGAEFEWSAAELENMLGYAPAGLRGLSDVWSVAPLPAYQAPIFGAGGFGEQAAGYILSAVAGVGLIFGVTLGTAKLLGAIRRRRALHLRSRPDLDAGARPSGMGSFGCHLAASGRRADTEVCPYDLGADVPVRPRPGRSRQSRRAEFVASTIASITSALQKTIFTEEQARLQGLLQRADPRTKVVALVFLLLSVALLHGLIAILLVYALALVLASMSNIKLDVFLKRVWIGIPLFAGLIAIPAMFTVPGQSVLVLAQVGELRLALTDNGIITASVFVARAGASVSLCLLLIWTTRWTDFLKSLRILRVPDAFVIVLGMTYRYLFLFLHLTNNLFLSRQSRTVGPTSGSEQRHWASATAGTLFTKSIKMSGEVHHAMLARGYRGEVRVLAQRPLLWQDWLLVTATLLLSLGVVYLDRIFLQ